MKQIRDKVKSQGIMAKNALPEEYDLLPKLSVSFTCKLKKINDYKWFPLKMLQVSFTAWRLRVNETLNLGIDNSSIGRKWLL